jgi:hypothetical protein
MEGVYQDSLQLPAANRQLVFKIAAHATGSRSGRASFRRAAEGFGGKAKADADTDLKIFHAKIGTFTQMNDFCEF